MAKARKYSVKSCHYKKGEAKKVQKRMHDKGLTAKVVKKTVKVGNKTRVKYCVESAGKKKH